MSRAFWLCSLKEWFDVISITPPISYYCPWPCHPSLLSEVQLHLEIPIAEMNYTIYIIIQSHIFIHQVFPQQPNKLMREYLDHTHINRI